MVGNLYTQISSDPGIITYLEGPECGDGNPHWAVRAAASIALLIKVVFVLVIGLKTLPYSIPGSCNSHGHHVCDPPLLPGHHDVLGPCIWSSLDLSLLLLYLDLSSSPTVHGYKV